MLDQGRDLARRAGELFRLSGAQLACVPSLAEFVQALESGPHYDRIIVDLRGPFPPETMASAIRGRFTGSGIAVVSDQSAATTLLAELPELDWVVVHDAAELDEALVRLGAAAAPGVEGPPCPSAASATFFGLVGVSRRMQEIFERIEKAALTDANICIVGESGTGKELIARAIHAISNRRDRPFITLDCTTIPSGLMETQLFGHVKGAFTGAVDHRDGVFTLAHTGTLFIDELCELELPLQGKLLRVIQTREFFKVGGARPIRTNIRLITATNRDIKAAAQSGAFREDLYYRVAVVMIRVPSLRERREDIPVLVEHFLRRFASVHNKPIRGVSPAAMDRLVGMPWPGNVRELENLLEQAVVLADHDMLTERDLFSEARAALGAPSPGGFSPGLPLREVERRHILATLQHVGGNRTEAARMLGISLRGLQYKLRSYLEDAQERPVAPAGVRTPTHRLTS
ncbi:MAG TPA: sigma-54 dependent transcriptional regulator [Candidatus Tectomicrobia bacterium]|nr:sigma-54 dependent transcriptional regulator [Candidatus Tectomicrobia bacterium]